MLISDPVSTLSDAMGWALQDNGEFEGRKNMIPLKSYELNKSNKGPAKIGSDNFQEIELRQVILEDQNIFSVLIIYYIEGFYKYPKIQQNWETFESVKFYVFKEENLSRLLPDGFKFNEPKVVNLDLIVSGQLIDYNPKTYLFKIQNSIREAIHTKKESLYTTLLAILPVEVKNEESIRFKFIEVLNKIDVYGKYLRKANWTKIFENSYYETSLPIFQSFINNVSPLEIAKINSPDYIKGFYASGMQKMKEENYPGAIVDFTKALKSNSDSIDHAELTLQRGLARYNAKDFEGSIADFSMIISDSLNSVKNKETWNKALYYRGLAYNENQNIFDACEDWSMAYNNGFQEAFKYIDKICAHEDNLDKPLSKKFRKQMKDGMKKYNKALYENAIVHFNKAEELQLDHNYLPLYFHRGISYYNTTQLSRANNDFTKAINQRPIAYSPDYILWADAFYFSGMLSFIEKDSMQGCMYVNSAIKYGSKLVDLSLKEKCLALRPIQEQAKDTSGFTKYYDKAIEAFKNIDYYGAISFFDMAEKIKPDHQLFEIYSYRGISKHKTENYTGAISDFDQILNQNNINEVHQKEKASILFNRGVSKYFLNDLTGACSDWAKAIDQGLEDKTAMEFIGKNCN